MNLYQYCRNNPVNWTDPWGLISPWTPIAPGGPGGSGYGDLPTATIGNSGGVEGGSGYVFGPGTTPAVGIGMPGIGPGESVPMTPQDKKFVAKLGAGVAIGAMRGGWGGAAIGGIAVMVNECIDRSFPNQPSSSPDPGAGKK